MSDASALEDARAAYERGAWSEACAQLAELDARHALGPEDLDRLATAAYLVGEDGTSDQARTRAHARFLERGDVIGAARSAFWLGFALVERPGQQAQAAGWLARPPRLVARMRGDRASHVRPSGREAYHDPRALAGDAAGATASAGASRSLP